MSLTSHFLKWNINVDFGNSMNAVCIARFPLTLNLTPLHHALEHQGIAHRFTEEQQQQLLWLNDPSLKHQAILLIDTVMASDSFFAEDSANASSVNTKNSPHVPSHTLLLGDAIKNTFAYFIATPITLVLIIFGLFGCCVVALKWHAAYELMTYTPIKILGTQVFAAPWQWQECWRAISPIFLHFGLGHIAFNAMAMLQLGVAVERIWQAKWYAFLCLSAGLVGNSLQYFWEYSPMFGGLSGVVYGIFTFNFITQRVNPAKAFILPRGMYIWLAVFLFAGFTPLFSVLFGVQVANGAHIGGALGGAFVACLANRNALYARFKSQP